MTKNQIDYWAQVENQRHNAAVEEIDTRKNVETRRHNRRTERQAYLELSEKNRSNLASESLKSQELSEKERSDRANEYLNAQAISVNATRASVESAKQQEEARWHDIQSDLKTAELVLDGVSSVVGMGGKIAAAMV